jgi:hypothetical protein
VFPTREGRIVKVELVDLADVDTYQDARVVLGISELSHEPGDPALSFLVGDDRSAVGRLQHGGCNIRRGGRCNQLTAQ